MSERVMAVPGQRRRRFSRLGIGLLGLVVAYPVPATGSRLDLELFTGGAINAKTPLDISQEGWPALELTANYDTRPFRQPLYYAVRVTYRRGEGSWVLDLVHHKLYLENPPPEVQHFSITHGFNLLTLGRRWEPRGFMTVAGAGVVVAHPESRIRAKTFREEGRVGGYYLAGPVIALGIGKRLPLTERLFASVEGRATLAYAFVPVADGDAELANVAFHALAGVGIRL